MADEEADASAISTTARRDPATERCLGLGFLNDTLYENRRFRTVNILDEGVRKELAVKSIRHYLQNGWCACSSKW